MKIFAIAMLLTLTSCAGMFDDDCSNARDSAKSERNSPPAGVNRNQDTLADEIRCGV